MVAGAQTVNVSVGAPSASGASLRSAHAKKGRLTISAAVTPPAPSAGAKVVVLGVNTASGAPAILQVLDHVTLTPGQTTVTLRLRAKRNTQWLLQVAYVQPGQASSFSPLRAVAVR